MRNSHAVDSIQTGATVLDGNDGNYGTSEEDTRRDRLGGFVDLKLNVVHHKEAIVKKDNARKHMHSRRSWRWCKVVVLDLVIVMKSLRLQFEVGYPSGAEISKEVKASKTGYTSLAPSLATGTT